MSNNYLGAPGGVMPTTHQTDAVMKAFVGLDLSMTCTGITVITGGLISTATVKSKGTKADSHEARYQRLRGIELDIIRLLPTATMDVHVAVEGPAFASVGGSSHERGGLWWMVYGNLYRLGATITVIPPTNLKKYATGSGNAGKDAVGVEVARRYPTVNLPTNDVTDSLVLAAMIARHHGSPVEESLPVKNLTAMDKIVWAK